VSGQRFGFRLNFLRDQTVKKNLVFVPATILALEEIAQHEIARRID
jgi:hypothetical protein